MSETIPSIVIDSKETPVVPKPRFTRRAKIAIAAAATAMVAGTAVVLKARSGEDSDETHVFYEPVETVEYLSDLDTK